MPTMNKSTTGFWNPPRKRLALAVIGVVLVAAALLLVYRRSHQASTEGATFTARRGPLDITVLQGGSSQALESQEVKCEVRAGQGVKILKIVEEGYQVTEDDIRTNKVLVELDSAELQKQIVQQDIQYEQAASSLIDAQQNYEIQVNQNRSDLEAAEQKVRFARMDFDKFLGDKVTQGIVDQLGLERSLAAEETNADARIAAMEAPEPSRPDARTQLPPGVTNNAAMQAMVLAALKQSTAGQPPSDVQLPPGVTNSAAMQAMVLAALAQPAAGQSSSNLAARVNDMAARASQGNAPSAPPADPPPSRPDTATASVVIDFSKYADINVLGDGEAKQKLRKFEDDLQIAQKEEGQAKSTLDGTKRLFDKGFMTKMDLERDELTAENNRLRVQTAETARDLFLKYEFFKSAEEALDKYGEAVRASARARKAAISKLAQARARLKSAQGQYNIQARQRKELYEQQDKCVITAKKPGLVVYGGARDDMYYYGGQEQIREGATVRERQAILTIPDMTKMSVRVRIHESYIKKVKKGLKVRITADAFPDKTLEGEVSNVGVLPDSQNRYLNPDMNVYLTTITINGTQDWLKPGMSAKVEILVNRLADVVYVPVQAVSPYDGKRVCYVANGGKPERRVVEIGEFNDEFVEIKNGLKEGERVLLRPAESPPPEKTGDKKELPATDKSSPQPATPAPGVTAMPAGKA
jgi:hypothetical protein